MGNSSWTPWASGFGRAGRPIRWAYFIVLALIGGFVGVDNKLDELRKGRSQPESEYRHPQLVAVDLRHHPLELVVATPAAASPARPSY